MAYEVEMPENSKIHNIFHVSRLKRVLGKHINPFVDLPPLDNEGKPVLEPKTILERRDRRLRNRTIPEYLVK